MSKSSKPLRLSPTTGLSLYRECPRCFWLHYNHDVHRPRGIFPSLPGGMDLVIKDYFDQYRGGLPPELKGKVKGRLVTDIETLNRWRNWRTGLEYRDDKLQAILFGALDDCLELDGKYLPLDYKTRGSAPEDGASERYYQTQLDTYALLLEANGYPAGDIGCLVYYFPREVQANGLVQFEVKPVVISVSATRAKKFFEEAVATLRGPLPPKHSQCEYCMWVTDLIDFD